MAKIIKKFLYLGVIPIISILLILMIIIKVINPNWEYKLSNDYFIKKTSSNVELVKKINNKYYTKYKDKKIGISSYVAEFQYNENFVGVKTIEIINEESIIYFYLVDTKEEEIHGPYTDEETYLAVVGVWSKEVLGDWISTLENPNK